MQKLALDEIYANNRQGAYLNVVDTDSWAVWAAEGPLSVDADSWTLLLWLAQDRGLRWHATVSDGGDALRAACQVVDPHGRHQRDIWHLFHFWNQIQRRVTRRLTSLHAQIAAVARQAARIAAGQKARGGHPRTDLAAHQADVAEVQQTDADLRALGHEVQRVLAVVVLDRDGVQDLARRQLLAVWHDHRVFRRGVHKGTSPLQLSGMLDAPTDWLVALGYPPASTLALPADVEVDAWELAA
jgi:hypothetical protein